MNRENCYRAFSHEHAPLIAPDWSRIVGCSCGWRMRHDAADSDTSFTDHVATARAAELPAPENS